MAQIQNGTPQGIRFDRRTTYFWWGEDSMSDGRDSVATAHGRVELFRSAAECQARADAAGWHQGDADTNVLDVNPVQGWLGRRRFDLDVESALNILNIALDFSAATGGSWDPRWGAAQNVYSKLVALNVPYAFDSRSYKSSWSPRENVVLRAALGQAVALLRRETRNLGAAQGHQ
ncbi:hypothetical protein [Subtercola frigoramans]|uniref:Uncharacterized protein n=1 Tax=Subtercola frigoramans TaxID=120298 RepID=A0ABS2L4B7_9MICO|nr:hypothetical protein [Subtercola frigoramans]MBM7471917.1 hypothetical protein [Subtercola frigoramans]